MMSQVEQSMCMFVNKQRFEFGDFTLLKRYIGKNIPKLFAAIEPLGELWIFLVRKMFFKILCQD